MPSSNYPKMKNVFIALICVLVLAACGGGAGGNEPKDVAINFNKALAIGDIETAKKYASEDSHQLLGMMAGMMSMAPDSVKEANKDLEFKFVRDSIVEDRAWVWLEADQEGGEAEAVELKQIDGEWKVVFAKN